MTKEIQVTETEVITTTKEPRCKKAEGHSAEGAAFIVGVMIGVMVMIMIMGIISAAGRH